MAVFGVDPAILRQPGAGHRDPDTTSGRFDRFHGAAADRRKQQGGIVVARYEHDPVLLRAREFPQRPHFHAVRGEHALTYAWDAPRAVTHGFLNVFVAACRAWHGDRDLEPILSETDPSAFRFDDRAHWRDRSLSEDEVRAARAEFAHAFGSCSFDEPTDELEGLGLL